MSDRATSDIPTEDLPTGDRHADSDTAAAVGEPPTDPVSSIPAPRDPSADAIDGGNGETVAGSGRRRRREDGDVRYGRTLLILIMAAAAVADAWDLTHDGVHVYYAAAVRTMAHSWHAFLVGAFDPAASVSLDKLPGGLWPQALVVRVFGMSTASIVAPQIIVGVLAVYALYRTLRRVAGQAAGLLGAAALAATPIAVLSARGNVPDGTCVLLLILAADATMRSIRTGRRRSLIWAAVLIGLAFQVKMLEAWLVLPGCAIAYLVAAPGRPLVRLRRLAVAGAVVAAVSLSWMTAIALTPAGDRPYVDGSLHDSIYAQVFDYNGVARFSSAPDNGLWGDRAVPAAVINGPATPQLVAPLPPPTWHRLLTGPIGRDAGWLLPLALATLIGGLALRRWPPRTDPVRAALIIWGGWLVPVAVAVSASHRLLSYYVGLLAAPVAALAALGLIAVYRARPRRWARAGVAVLLGSTVATSWTAPRWLLLIVAAAALAAFVVAALPRRSGRWALGAAVIVALVGPAISTGVTVAHGGTPWDAPFAARGTVADQAAALRDPVLSGVIEVRTSAVTWHTFTQVHDSFDQAPGRVLYVSGAAASAYIAGGGRRVVVVGGYTGLVDSPTVHQLAAMLREDIIGFAIVPGSGSPYGYDPRFAMLRADCAAVHDYGVVVVVNCQGANVHGS